jgi:hypothetical protein
MNPSYRLDFNNDADLTVLSSLIGSGEGPELDPVDIIWYSYIPPRSQTPQRNYKLLFELRPKFYNLTVITWE